MPTSNWDGVASVANAIAARRALFLCLLAIKSATKGLGVIQPSGNIFLAPFLTSDAEVSGAAIDYAGLDMAERQHQAARVGHHRLRVGRLTGHGMMPRTTIKTAKLGVVVKTSRGIDLLGTAARKTYLACFVMLMCCSTWPTNSALFIVGEL